MVIVVVMVVCGKREEDFKEREKTVVVVELEGCVFSVQCFKTSVELANDW